MTTGAPTGLSDPGGVRPIVARWTITAELVLETASHLGGGTGGVADMVLVRDARTGAPLLPGTSIAGALRSHLADVLGGYRSSEDPRVSCLFGGARGDDPGAQSPLIVFDGIGTLPVDHAVEIRDGVQIDTARGVAEDHKKFDLELLPAGTSFPLRFDLLISQASNEPELLGLLMAALDGLSSGDIALGARRSRGLGRVRVRWAAKRFGLQSREGWIHWLVSDHERPNGATPDQACVRNAIEAAAPEHLRPLSPPTDVRKRVVIDLDLRLEHDILVRSPSSDPGGPDVRHLRSGGSPVLPGTGLAGVLRAHSLRVANLVRAGKNDARLWVDRLWGPRFEGPHPTGGSKPCASRLRVGEARLEGGRAQRQIRVAIDRFTQGVVETALFDEETEVGGRAKVRLELRNPERGELGLVLLVLKDLLGGALPVGGTVAVGRGVVHGSATVTWYESGGRTTRSAHLVPGRPPTGEAAEDIDRAIREFHEEGSLAKTAVSAPGKSST